MIVQCATFSKILNPRNIDKTVSDIRIRIRFPFEISFWISLFGCKLTVLPDIQPANRIVIISGVYTVHSCSVSVFIFKTDTQIHYCISISIVLWVEVATEPPYGISVLRMFKQNNNCCSLTTLILHKFQWNLLCIWYSDFIWGIITFQWVESILNLLVIFH